MSPRSLHAFIQRRRDANASPSPYDQQRRINQAREKPTVFVELDTRHNDGYTVSLEWNRETGKTQIVVGDIRTASKLVLPVPAANASDAFHHPFRYAP